MSLLQKGSSPAPPWHACQGHQAAPHKGGFGKAPRYRSCTFTYGYIQYLGSRTYPAQPSSLEIEFVSECRRPTSIGAPTLLWCTAYGKVLLLVGGASRCAPYTRRHAATGSLSPGDGARPRPPFFQGAHSQVSAYGEGGWGEVVPQGGMGSSSENTHVHTGRLFITVISFLHILSPRTGESCPSLRSDPRRSSRLH